MSKEFTDIDIQNLFENNTSLSNSSKNAYISTLKRLISICKYNTANLPKLKKDKNIIIKITNEKNIYSILNNPTIYTNKFKICIENNSTYISTLAFILTIIKNLKLSESKEKKIIKIINEWQNIYKTEINNKNKTSINNENTISIEWSDILKKQKEFQNKSLGSNDTLLISIYSLLPPRKIKDYCLMEINPQNYKTTESNFINLKAKKSFISINKKNDIFVKEIPIQLDEIIKQNLDMFPRKYLFVSKKNIPFENNIKGINSLTKQINRDLNNIFGENITINTIRNSYIKYQIDLYKEKKISLKELKELSNEIAYDISYFIHSI